MPVAEIALPRAATRCFPDLVSGDSNGLVLISFRLARKRPYARRRGLARRQRLSRRLTASTTRRCRIRSVISQASAPVGGCVLPIEELLSPDLDQIKQGEQAA
jgi:hypothetical protein